MDSFPIRVISELSGVPATTLRAWERRYGLLKPIRTPKGHRKYTTADLKLVQAVVQLLEQGHAISEAARIVRQQQPGATTPPRPVEADAHWSVYRKRMLSAVETFNTPQLDAVYNEALSLYPADLVSEQLITPVMQVLGERWQARPAGVAEEHFFTAYLRNKLGARLHHEGRQTRGRTLMLACLPGEFHDLGLLLFELALLGRGYRVLYLGQDLPLAQIPLILDRKTVDGVLLSGTSPGPDDAIKQGLSELATALAERDTPCPLMIGGEWSETRHDWLQGRGMTVLGSQPSKALDVIEAVLPAHAG